MKSLVLGVEFMSGTSDKGKGRPYSIHRAHIVMPNDGWSNEHGRCLASGFRPVEQAITPACFAQLEKLTFPAFVDFAVDHQPGRKGLELVLTEVTSSKSLSAA